MVTKAPKPSWGIAITFGDEENKGFLTLGGAAWDTQTEWEQHWQAILVSLLCADAPAMLIADKLNPHGERIEERRIDAATVEWMLGRSLAELFKSVERKRHSHGFALERQPGRESEVSERTFRDSARRRICDRVVEG